MHLLIRAVSLAGQPLTQAISAYFDERGGTIGRSDTNTLALPDPERRISRLQAEVSRGNEGWRVLNVGNANPIWHNNKPVPPGEAVMLDEGDELQIGTYALQVNYSKNDATARTITKGRAAVDSRTVIVGSGAEPKTDPGLMRPEVRSDMRMATPAPVAASSPFADLLGDMGASSTPPGVPASAASGSPFADLMGLGSPAASMPAPAVAAAPAPTTAPTRLPDDFDPFADLQSTPSPTGRSAASAGGSWDLPKAASAPASASPFDFAPDASSLPGNLDLMGSVAPAGAQSLDRMFGLGGAASNADPLAGFLKQTEPEAVSEAAVGAPTSVDPLALLASRQNTADERLGGPTQMRSALPDNVPEINAAMSLPPVMEAKAEAKPMSAAAGANLLDDLDLSPPTVPRVHISANPAANQATNQTTSQPAPAEHPLDFTMPSGIAPVTESLEAPSSALPTAMPAAQAVRGGTADTQALWAAFCEGAGVKFAPPQGLNPALMRVIGQLLHHAVDGSLKLVAARAATKQEMRAEVTVIQARANNPLKFSPDTQSAMEQLLQPPMRGFMSGPEAVSDAMDDLLGHTIGTMVGTRAALEGVLARFEPEQLETKLVGRSVMDSLLPMNRRAKLWELYLQHYGAVRTEAQDDFHNLFGRAFLQAYEDQLDRLDKERRQRGHAQPVQPKSGASA